MWLLNSVPLAWLGVTVISLAVVSSLAGLLLVRRYVPSAALMRHNDVAGLVYAGVSVIYGVLLPLVVADVWAEFRIAGNEIAAEALALDALMVDAAQFSSGMAADMRRAVYGYASAVVNDEWTRMAWGEESQVARQRLKDIERVIGQANVSNPREQAAFAELLGHIDDVAEHRTARLIKSQMHLSGVMWGVILLGGVIVVGYTYLYGVESLRSQMIMTAALATIIATVVIVILALDHPFSGDLRLTPEYFQRILIEINTAASPAARSAT